MAKNYKQLISIGIVSITFATVTCATPPTVQNQPKSNQFWWPNQLDLTPLRTPSSKANPFGDNYNYAEAFQKLDLDAVKQDINTVLTTSQDWWPADYGNYGPFFIRMAWHSAGTYRIHDGRGGADGGQQRFDPLNSWPDNGNLDKARRLLWPIKQKYGQNLSWADLIVLTGNVAMENMGFKTLGFAGGRQDDWVPDLVYWGPETQFMGNQRYKQGQLEKPLAATQMGLIYVNPEGPNGKPDPVAAAKDIRDAFGRMAMSDEETVALIAGGHAFGKSHGAHSVQKCLGKEPAAASIEQQGLGWKNTCGKGNAEDTITSGLEGAWTPTPVKWTTTYLDNLFNFDWEQTKSPSGAIQWVPKNGGHLKVVPDAHVKDTFHAPIMFTTDLSLKMDPKFNKIAKRFQQNPQEFEQAFANAWFKLIHRDMGPRTRYLGKDVPNVEFTWQDPVPKADYKPISEKDIQKLKANILKSGLSMSDLVTTAWGSAASFRASDHRGGSNGGRIRLAPQNQWPVNNPQTLTKVLTTLQKIQQDFNKAISNQTQVSMADLIVLGGNAAIEQAAEKAGTPIKVPFTPGRTDASQEQTDVESFAVLEPKADGFRNYYDSANERTPAEMLVDKASLLNLNVPEMTVLVGGMRALGANSNQSKHGVLTEKPGTLSNDFFVNLLDMSTQWQAGDNPSIYQGVDRASGKPKWTATEVDLIFGSNPELRAVSEVYAFNDSKQKFVDDFVAAWNKVMNQG